VPGPNRSG